MKKRLFSALLIFALISIVFVSGCKPDGKTPNGEGSKPVTGITLQDYKIIYPKNAYGLEPYCAELLADYIKNVAGMNVEFGDDESATEVHKEILIGKTNRSESTAAHGLTYEADEILIQEAQDKIVLYGKDLMMAGAVGQFASKFVKTDGKVVGLSKTLTKIKYETVASQNVIVLIGDGMGTNHIEYVKSKNETFNFFGEYLSNRGEASTFSMGASASNPTAVTDSAAAGTALGCGVKTYNYYVGMDTSRVKHKNLVELGGERGYKTAVVTTDARYGATPSGFTAHVNHRDSYDDIKKQQDKLVTDGILTYIKGTGGRGTAAENEPDKVVETDGTGSAGSSGYEMYPFVKEGLWKIHGDGTNKFFAMIEDDDIDNRSHREAYDKMESVLKRFNRSMGYAFAFAMAHPGTALIVTADHETGGLSDDFKWTSAVSYNIRSHTTKNVPIFTYGEGMNTINGKVVGTDVVVNTDIPKHIATIMGAETFPMPLTV